MKSKGLIIVLISLLAIIIVALIGILVLSINGKFNFLSGFKNLGRKSTDIIFDERYESDEINNIVIISEAGNIIFEESEENDIRVVAYGQNNGDCKVSLNKDRLKIDYSENYKKSWFNFYTNDIIIYLPSDYSHNIDITSNYGDCEITDLENATISIDADYGNINIEKVKNVDLKCDYGDIEIDTVLNRCEIKSDCGDIKIENVKIKEDSSIKIDLGDVKIRKINDIYVDASVDLGDVKVDNNNRYSDITLKIEVDCGDIKVGN